MTFHEQDPERITGIKRRHFLGLLAAGSLALMAGACGERNGNFALLWRQFRRRFISADGRVLDTDNGAVNHSEGQGWGMLFAAHANDWATFDDVWAWTRANLQVRDDNLFAWRYDSNGSPPVGDSNNACDGDIYIAWSLLEAGRRTGRAQLIAQADRVLADLERRCVKQDGNDAFLLPGAVGFEQPEGLVLNPSYFVFPAFSVFEKHRRNGVWRSVFNTSSDLIARSRFGQYGLPPDWLMVGGDGTLSPAPDRPPRFGWDAIRVPLFVSWTFGPKSELLKPTHDYLATFKDAPDIPAWIDLTNGDRAPYPLPPGGHELLAHVARKCRACNGASWLPDRSAPARLGEEGYYGSALRLLTALAGQYGS
ncbi:MAG: glycosyl hydrolase family 8 [Sphingomonadales bacterium]